MNLRSIAQTATVLGWFGTDWESSPEPEHTGAISEYWKNSRFLFRNWSKRIQESRTSPESLHTLSQFLEEILVSELLTRVMSAKLLAIGERTQEEEPTTIAFKSMNEHQQARQALFNLIEQNQRGVSTYLRCERLARKVERWSDFIISPFSDSAAAIHASYEKHRCLEFGDEWIADNWTSSSLLTFQIQLAALSISLPNQHFTKPYIENAHRSRCDAALTFVTAEPANSWAEGHVEELCSQLSNGIDIDSVTKLGTN